MSPAAYRSMIFLSSSSWSNSLYQLRYPYTRESYTEFVYAVCTLQEHPTKSHILFT
jgi:hypothetical protein